MNIQDSIRKLGDQALAASRRMVRLSSRKKNAILLAMADAVDRQRDVIQAANAQDIDAARAAGLSGAMIDRLTLTDARIDAMVTGIREVAALTDHDAFGPEQILVVRHQAGLADGRAHLEVRHTGGARLHAQGFNAGADCAGRDQQHLIALAVQVRHLFHEAAQGTHVRAAGGLGDDPGPDLDNNAPGFRQKFAVTVFDIHKRLRL